LDNNHAMNVKPKNYEWRDFYDHVIGLTRYTFSGRAIVRRFRATRAAIPRWMNVVRAVSSEGFGRIRYHTELRQRLDTDQHLRRYFDQETTEIPEFYVERVRQDLGPLWQWLPEGALYHDHHAYLKSEEPQPLEPVSVSRADPPCRSGRGEEPLFPGDPENAVAARAAQHLRVSGERGPVAAAGTHRVLVGPGLGQPPGVARSGHDAPRFGWRSPQLHGAPRQRDLLAVHVDHGVARCQLGHAIPRPTAHAVVRVLSQASPLQFGHLRALGHNLTPTITVATGSRECGTNAS